MIKLPQQKNIKCCGCIVLLFLVLTHLKQKINEGTFKKRIETRKCLFRTIYKNLVKKKKIIAQKQKIIVLLTIGCRFKGY